MQHELTLEGRAFRLRPVGVRDAAFIVALRGDARAATTLHPVSGLVEDQVAWIEAYLSRPGEWYWIVERLDDGTPEGTIGIYDLEPERGRALWGRWILRPGSLAAAESVLLVYGAGFERLGLDELYALTVATNARVLSFHESAGLERTRHVAGAFELADGPADAVEHTLRRGRWPETKSRLETHAERVAALLWRDRSREGVTPAASRPGERRA